MEKARQGALQEAIRRTQQLRSSSQPRWQRVRERLRQEGIAPEEVVVADHYEADDRLDFELLVLKDGRSIGVDLDYLRDEDGRQTSGPEDAWISAWNVRPEGQHLPGLAQEIELGLRLLGEGGIGDADGT